MALACWALLSEFQKAVTVISFHPTMMKIIQLFLGFHMITKFSLLKLSHSVCVYVSIYMGCESDEPLLRFMAPPIPSSPWPSSYQFDWMICNMSSLI